MRKRTESLEEMNKQHLQRAKIKRGRSPFSGQRSGRGELGDGFHDASTGTNPNTDSKIDDGWKLGPDVLIPNENRENQTNLGFFLCCAFLKRVSYVYF